MENTSATKRKSYFTPFEIFLWCFSLCVVIVMFCVFDRTNWTSLVGTIMGINSLVFNTKGNPLGQVFGIIFSVFYGIVSFTFAYYGEMITYLGMTAPMALIALISWLKNPFHGKRSEVSVNKVHPKELVFSLFLTGGITVAFYFILRACNTANLITSTISVATSFLAVYLTYRRSPLHAIAYAANDVVLIVLWSLAIKEDISYISTLMCFILFLLFDIYGFTNWTRMRHRQRASEVEYVRESKPQSEPQTSL